MNQSETQLVPAAQMPLAAQPASQAPTITSMMSAVIAGGVTGENVAALKELVALYRDMQKDDAAKAFASAFVDMQSELPAIQTTKAVPNKDGSIRYHFAPYDKIMDEVRPFLQKHGFTVTFSQAFQDGRVVQSCTLQHVGGHARTNKFGVRIGNGPPGSSEAQGDGAASTYAKRFALCDALNIVCEHDTDARKMDAAIEGAPISVEQVCFLRELVTQTKSDVHAFLAFAGAAKFEEIPQSRYDRVVAALRRKAGAS